VVAEELPGPGSVFLQVNWKFIAPVRPGDTITGEVEVTHARRKTYHRIEHPCCVARWHAGAGWDGGVLYHPPGMMKFRFIG